MKLIATLTYIVTVVSFSRYEFLRLIPYVFYPVIVMALSETPWSMILKRVLLALPFVVLAGLSNILFDTQPGLWLGSLAVSRGVVSCFAIFFRTFLCVVAILLLVAVTPFSALTGSLRAAHVPGVFVTLFEMTYRYIAVLLEEAGSMYTAYLLRHTHRKGLELRHMGSFVGQLLLKSFDRAERIYAAMQCRGYAFHTRLRSRRPLRTADWLFLLATAVPFVLLRLFDLSQVFSAIGGLLLCCR